MTSEVDRIPVGPPWSVDDVADVQAGVFSPEVTAELRARILADAQGAAILAALDSTVDDLSLLPPLVMPARYASRLDQAIAAEAQARAEGRTPPLVTGSFGTLRQTTGVSPAGSPTGLPTLPPAALPDQRTRPEVPAGPPRRHAPLIPAVLPGADRHQTRRTPPMPRQLGSVPPYAPSAAAHAQTPAGPPDNRPGRAGGPTGRGPADGRPGTVSSLDAHRARRRGWTRGLLAAAAVAVLAVGTVIGIRSFSPSQNGGTAAPAVTLSSTTTVAAPGLGSPGVGAGLQAFAIEPGKFAEAFDKLNGVHEGKLTEAPVFASCLGQNNVSGSDVLGVSDVTYQGRDAMAIAVSIAGDSTHVRILVVGTGCGPNGPELLADETVAR